MTDPVALVVDAPGAAQTWTYAELWERVHREARRLGEHGIGRGSVVVVLTGDSPLTFVMRRAVNAVVPRAGRAPTPGELVDWVVRERGRGVAPARVQLVDELPTTPSAKVDRTALRARFAARWGVRPPTIGG